MNPDQAAQIAPQLEAIAGGGETAKGRRPRTLLPSAAPQPGSPRGELAAWVTVALALGADPVARVERYGLHEDARLVILLHSGKRITFDRAADAFDARRLERVIVLATGAMLPHYAGADAASIAGAIVRLAETLAEDDSRSEAAEWGRAFLRNASPNTIDVAETHTPAGRYEALCALTAWKAPEHLSPYAPASERAPVVHDTASGQRLVRVSDLAAHVRGQLGRPLGWSALHGRMVEVGWEHRGEVEQRQPGGHSRVRVHAYAIPPGWEGS